jgi:hypothetical protein
LKETPGALAFPAHDLAKEWLNGHDLARLEAEIGLATGKTLTLKADTSDIDVFDWPQLPAWTSAVKAHAGRGRGPAGNGLAVTPAPRLRVYLTTMIIGLACMAAAWLILTGGRSRGQVVAARRGL